MLENIYKVKNGEVTAEDIVKERLTLLEKYKDYNSVICLNKEEVLAQAKALDTKIQSSKSTGCLAGAIITVKDNLDVKGLPSTGGIKKYRDNLLKDCRAVEKLRAEDAIILGKTNMPAGAMDVQTFNDIYGRTKHPIFPEYTCGGSSGGGACAVKLGISDGDIGNDFMGSIRIPAHFCGIYGIVATDKIIPPEPLTGGRPYGSTMSGILRIGIQASSLEDLYLLYEVLCEKAKLLPCNSNESPLRIAYTKNSGSLPLAKDYELAYTSFINKLNNVFLTEEISDEKFSFEKARQCFLKLIYGNIAISIPPMLRPFIKPKMSAKLKAYLLAEEEREQCLQQLEQLFNNFDVLISPVSATAAFKHKLPVRTFGQQQIYEDMLIDGRSVPYSVANMGYTTPFSLTSSPVIVMPIGISSEGLPLGVQLIGKSFQDLDLMASSLLIEKQLHTL